MTSINRLLADRQSSAAPKAAAACAFWSVPRVLDVPNQLNDKRTAAVVARSCRAADVVCRATGVVSSSVLMALPAETLVSAREPQPAPNRKQETTWSTFLKAHWDVLAAIDFTTVEVWTKGGLITYYLLFVMELKTRRVHFAGAKPNPNESWMKQAARELTAFDDGFLNGKRYLVMDRDASFCQSFRDLLANEAIEPIRLPPRSPNLNSYIERFFRSLKSESVERMIFFGESSLRNAIREYLTHYHGERNHQGLDNELIEPAGASSIAGQIECRERLGGLLKHYYRDAA